MILAWASPFKSKNNMGPKMQSCTADISVKHWALDTNWKPFSSRLNDLVSSRAIQKIRLISFMRHNTNVP